ncbi:MAG: hypothetical protein ACLQA5_05175 [Solirubrobacteraceae bacterium]
MVTSTTSSLHAGGSGQPWTIRRLIAAHKPVALAVAAVCALTVAMFLFAVLGPKAGAVTDATTCSQWGSANWSQQSAYARRYVEEHGGIDGQTSPMAVINTINNECMVAYGEDVDDTTSVVQAISGNF